MKKQSKYDSGHALKYTVQHERTSARVHALVHVFVLYVWVLYVPGRYADY